MIFEDMNKVFELKKKINSLPVVMDINKDKQIKAFVSRDEVIAIINEYTNMENEDAE